MNHHRICILIFCLFVISTNLSFGQAIPVPGRIGNPNPVGSGARALGMGNAFIAIADDATAASWNPGGLTQLQKPEFSFALETVSRDTNSKTKFNDGLTTNFKGSNSIDFEDFNYASIVYPYVFNNMKHMVFSLNYLKLYRFDDNFHFPFSVSNGGIFPPTPPINLIGTDKSISEGTFTTLSPAIAIDISPKLSLGVTFNIWNHGITNDSYFEVKETQVLNTFVFGSLSSTQTTVRTSRYDVDKGYSWILGGLYKINDIWTLGAVIKPDYKLDLDLQRESFRNTNGTIATTIWENSADLNFPWIFGLGISCHPNDPLTVSMDITWTEWSKFTLEELGVTYNPKLTPEIGGSPTRSDLKDTYTLRLGAEYVLEHEKYLVPLRCGIGYDPSPAIDSSDDFVTVNIGAGLQVLDRFNIDIAYEYRWGDGVNQTSLQVFNQVDKGDQDEDQHRVMLSAIIYF